jgi:hypothetical protein
MEEVRIPGKYGSWLPVSTVRVPGVPDAGDRVEDWQTVAVLEVQPPEGVGFLVAFKNGGNMQRNQTPVQMRNGRFGMRVGPEDVEFYALAIAPALQVEMRLVEVTTIDNPDYSDLPLY